MSDDQISPREYGNLEAQVAQLTRDVAALTRTVNCMNEILSQAKGGWRSVAWIAGISASLAAVGAWATTHLRYTP